jgi:hypothetical protein
MAVIYEVLISEVDAEAGLSELCKYLLVNQAGAPASTPSKLSGWSWISLRPCVLVNTSFSLTHSLVHNLTLSSASRAA